MGALPNARAMFHLRVLGAAVITDVHESPAAELLAHPRRLSLLFVLASSARGAVSRDWLSALFWPEADEKSARTALRQALYVLHRDLGTEVVRSFGKHSLGLDRDCVDSDVAEFERALRDQRWNDGLTAYRGDFLEGFHLREAQSFERWVDGERGRLRGLAHGAARELLRDAQRLGDPHLVLVAARQGLRFAPSSGSLIRALAAAQEALGDTGGGAAGMSRVRGPLPHAFRTRAIT